MVIDLNKGEDVRTVNDRLHDHTSNIKVNISFSY